MARGRARGKKTAATKRKGTSNEDETSPTKKLKREDSMNTQLRKAIAETKKSGAKKKVFKPDARLIDECGAGIKIYEDYSCMLNQTNIGKNNNKFYVIQVGDDKGSYVCFTKWGRVGEPGLFNTYKASDIEDAIKAFKKKFKDKTKNDWDKREKFQAVPGKYTILEIDEESDDDEVDAVVSTSASLSVKVTKSGVKCTLDVRTELLIKLIFNDDMFTDQMANMNLDVRKMPLGKLSKSQIAKGLEALLNIEEAFKKNKNQEELATLTSTFYTLIPHDFGRRIPPVIDDQTVINQKKELMMTLSDIELTQTLQKLKGDDKVHPLDDKYDKLGCDLELIDKNSEEFKMLKSYATAANDTRKGPILDAWRVNRHPEGKRFSAHDKIKHRKLLWHGTSVAVVAAILNSGLRIMPHSGGRVGRGIYFASEHRKSSWYVGTHHQFEKEKEIGFMFLTEVALGNEKNIDKDNSSLKSAPSGFDSVVARGMTEPDPKKDIKRKFDGKDVIVPLGKPIKSEYKNSYFGESEYLVYKESQARIRYLLKFSFA